MSTPTIENDDQNKENNLFYLVKDVSKDSVGLKDSEGNPIAFFDEKDKGVVQSTALLQKLNNLEFALGSSGSVNSSWYSFLQAGTHTYEDTTGWDPSTFIINWITTTTATDDIGKCRELEVSWATSILNSWEATASKRQGRGTATATFGEIFFLTIKNQLLVANSSLSSLTDSSALKVHIEGILSGANDHSTLPGSAGRSTIPIKEYFKYFNISDGTKFQTPGELSDFITIINSIYGDTLSDQLDVQRNNLSSFQSISQSVLSFQSNTEFALGPYVKGEDRITGYQNIETEEVVSELPEGSDVTDYNLLYGNFSVIDELKDRYSKYSDFANVQTVISGVMLNNELIESKDFQSLIDTPTGYLGHSGDYLVVNSGESGIHFTGIEKIAQDLTDYGFGGDGFSIPKYTNTNLPDPTENDGKIVASGCDLYYGCNGEWNKIGADSIPPPEDVPGCVSDLEEYAQYQEYKDNFLSDNMNLSFDSMFNEDESLSDLIIDVCLFPQVNNQTNYVFNPKTDNTVVIQESTYKWGMFVGQTEINLLSNPYVDPNGEIECNFANWQSSEVVSFGDANAESTTAIINQDVSITGYFNCNTIGVPLNCDDVAVHIQSNNNDLPADKSIYQRPVVRNTLNSTSNKTLFEDSVFSYDQDQDYLRIDDVNLNLMSNDYNVSNYPFMTIETWYNPSSFQLTGGSSQGIFRLTGVELLVNGTTNNLVPIGTLILQGIGQIWKIPNSQLTLDQWHHIAVVYERLGGIVSVYINGVLAGFTEGRSFINTTSTWWIGCRATSLGVLRGYLQDFKVTLGRVYSNNFTPPNKLHSKCT